MGCNNAAFWRRMGLELCFCLQYRGWGLPTYISMSEYIVRHLLSSPFLLSSNEDIDHETTSIASPSFSFFFPFLFFRAGLLIS